VAWAPLLNEKSVRDLEFGVIYPQWYTINQPPMWYQAVFKRPM